MAEAYSVSKPLRLGTAWLLLGGIGLLWRKEEQAVREKTKKYLQMLCDVLELVAAAFVLLGILLAIVSLLRDFELFRRLSEDISIFQEYLEEIFTIVIGIEFLQMLCRPNSDNVIEILIFLVARHMVVGETTPYQDFVSVISVALLCVLRRYLSVMKQGGQWRSGKQKKEEP